MASLAISYLRSAEPEGTPSGAFTIIAMDVSGMMRD